MSNTLSNTIYKVDSQSLIHMAVSLVDYPQNEHNWCLLLNCVAWFPMTAEGNDLENAKKKSIKL